MRPEAAEVLAKLYDGDQDAAADALANLLNKQKGEVEDPNRPTLRRAPGSDKIEMGDEKGDGNDKVDDDERPTLKRRPN